MEPGDTNPLEVFNEPYPCEGCPFWTECATAGLACRSYFIYINQRGKLDVSHRFPSLFWYWRCFHKRTKKEREYDEVHADPDPRSVTRAQAREHATPRLLATG